MMDAIDPEAVRRGYDAVAPAYAEHLYGELAHKSFDRWWLDRFVSLTRGLGPLSELGCGPGQVARYLKDHGAAEVFGADLSERMLAEARRRSPDIPFRRQDMLALTLADRSLGGIAAFYAIVHFTPRQAEQAFREMCRVLAPGGYALVAFHVAEMAAPRRGGAHELRHVDELFGVTARLDFVLHDVDDVVAGMKAAGLSVEEVTLRYPYPEVEVQTKRAYILARRPPEA
jgi:ubiquinone/menaquinone biosynthesis C-methylase UbiE